MLDARYDYDPYGRPTPVGTIITASDFQYAGYYEHQVSGLNFTWPDPKKLDMTEV
jgi:hypothetical protein